MLTEKQRIFKEEWIRRLRNGEWVQITDQLGDNGNGRCCLGVACDVAISQGCDMTVRFDKLFGKLSYDYDDSYQVDCLPEKVIDEFDIPLGSNGEIFLEDFIDNSNNMIMLSELNDSGFTFDQIADIIDWYWV